MKLRKGNVIVFAEKSKPNETIIKASNDPIKGEVITDAQEYSTDFIHRWQRFGFIRVFKNSAAVPANLVK